MGHLNTQSTCSSPGLAMSDDRTSGHPTILDVFSHLLVDLPACHCEAPLRAERRFPVIMENVSLSLGCLEAPEPPESISIFMPSKEVAFLSTMLSEMWGEWCFYTSRRVKETRYQPGLLCWPRNTIERKLYLPLSMIVRLF